MHPLSNFILVPGLPIVSFLVWTKWFVERREKRSRRPFDDMPRPAGWSLQCRMEDLMSDFTLFLTFAMLAGFVAWVLAYSKPEGAIVYLSVGFVACCILLGKSAKVLLSYANHRLGFLGERVVGQILDQLSSDSIRVFHDLEVREPGGKPWNIDHVVVSPAGVFAIETKSRRKSRRTNDNRKGYKLVFDGQRILFPEPMKPDRNALVQAQRNAERLSSKLSSLNGEVVPVLPALVFPGWWVEDKGKGEIAVMNPKLLPNFLSGRPTILSDRLVHAICHQLEERCTIDLSARC